MGYGRYSISTLRLLLETLGFYAEGFLGDNTDKLKYVHSTRTRTLNRFKNYITIPLNLKSANKTFCLRVLLDLEDFGFSKAQIYKAANEVNLLD